MSADADTDLAEELIETRMRLHAALAEAKSLSIQIGYLRAELVEARADARLYTESRIEAVA